MTPSPPSKSELAAAIYRQFESRLMALKAAAPFTRSKRREYYERAEEIRALYRALRKLESGRLANAGRLSESSDLNRIVAGQKSALDQGGYWF